MSVSINETHRNHPRLDIVDVDTAVLYYTFTVLWIVC